MTNCNYTLLSNSELIDIVNEFDIPKTHLNRYLKNHHMYLYDELVRRTNFLGLINIPLSVRLYCIANSMIEFPKCANPNCNNKVSWVGKHDIPFKKYCCKKCQLDDQNYWDKIRNTNIERYGVKYPSQSKYVKTKVKNTCIERYGVDNPAKTIGVQQKMKNTCIERYGVDNVFKSDVIKDNIRNQQFERFGGHWFVETQDFKDKSKVTLNKHYGVDHPMKSVEVVESGMQTSIERYGVSRFAKSHLFSSSHRKRILHDGIYFDSNWEIIVYDHYKTIGSEVEYSPNIVFEYEYDGNTFAYHPDFLIDGTLYEVKGDHFFRIDESGNEVMYNPFRDKNISNEEYEWICGKYEAKHQCMLRNDVVILREKDIKAIIGDRDACEARIH